MRYTYRVYYYEPLNCNNNGSMLIRAKTVADAKRKFKRKFPERKVIIVK